jgi:hypothetical protein
MDHGNRKDLLHRDDPTRARHQEGHNTALLNYSKEHGFGLEGRLRNVKRADAERARKSSRWRQPSFQL